MKYLLNWEEAFQSGVSMVGGKGWNLGRLAQYGFSIPQGGVLTAQAYDEYIKHNQLQEIVGNLASSTTLENLYEADVKDRLGQLRKKIMGGSIPPSIVEELSEWLNSWSRLKKAWAVRSSAIAEDSEKASFAGIHDSFLNVCGLDDILSAVKGCYASLWSPRAVAYRQKMNINDTDIKTAVVVMEMVEAQAAGVGFTCDLLSGRQDVMVVNANFGLGESVVSGTVEPDTYYLEAEAINAGPRLMARKIGRKQGLTIKRENEGTQFIESAEIHSQQVLQDKEIEKLGRLLLRVFDALGNSEKHQDVEWVYDGREFVLVQARPVTTLPRKTFPALQNQPDIWSNGNYRDAIPMVQSPLNRRLMKNIIDIIHFMSFKGLGYKLPVGIQFSRFYNGRLYCNLPAYQWGMYDSMGSPPDGFNVFWGGHQPTIDIGDLKPQPGFEERAMKFGALINQTKQNAAQIWERVSTSVQKITEKGLKHWTDLDFITHYDELGRITRVFASEFNLLAAVGSMPVVFLLQTLSKYFEGRELMIMNALMVGGTEGITSADHGYKLVELAEIARKDADAAKYLSRTSFDPSAWKELPECSPFKQAFCEFIKEYGHRAVYELDIINSRWNEDQTYLLGIIQSTMNTAGLGKLREDQKEKQKQAWLEIKDKVPASEHSSIRNMVRESQAGAAVREKTKSVLALVMDAYRMIARELGCRFYEKALIKEPDDVFFCTWTELFSVLSGEWDGRGLQALIAVRKDWTREMESLAPPDVIFGKTPKFTEPITRVSRNCLVGVPAAAGKASGSVRLISHPDEGGRLQPGEVIVAPSTDPGWTPLFLKAGAIVMETGGFLSHGAIVAREYGIPAVVNIPGVMGILEEGQTIVVDGDNGKIFLSDEDIK
ncbi:PEP/pyruvate-binding domain-containing protein [Clostridium sp. OS1-26]|uniref:PEP/pyruvate-binding domain-containing protein n=1 Tax=Clostridium sp. OS1-26 TaxID=3070681 RepID=UPI0027DF7807|nr:PEP/pyruvate-binding domain-containing protein [Clostridium sp. OS1-26]WML34792.1 PEP/pyruvate-binding domain-containing protein [Clostridium sp. OS1-26]